MIAVDFTAFSHSRIRQHALHHQSICTRPENILLASGYLQVWVPVTVTPDACAHVGGSFWRHGAQGGQHTHATRAGAASGATGATDRGPGQPTVTDDAPGVLMMAELESPASTPTPRRRRRTPAGPISWPGLGPGPGSPSGLPLGLQLASGGSVPGHRAPGRATPSGYGCLYIRESSL